MLLVLRWFDNMFWSEGGGGAREECENWTISSELWVGSGGLN